MSSPCLIPIFADQLSLNISSLKDQTPDSCIIFMCEIAAEAETVQHHRKKLVFLFSAMRHFAQELIKAGYIVDYVKLTDPENRHNFTDEIQRALRRHYCTQIRLCEPSEHRVKLMAKSWKRTLGVDVQLIADDRFIASHQEFSDWAAGRKSLRMEYFYRNMRRKTGLLMDHDQPEGGRWNYDSQNRKPAKADLFMPSPLGIKPDQITQNVTEMVGKLFPKRFGDLDGFDYAVTRQQARHALKHFIDHALGHFGEYQDAMLIDAPYLYHSRLSAYLNIGLLTPMEICEAVEQAYYDGKAPINATEGYIRQIIGWREYIRGIYWLHMPDYARENALKAQRPLPEFYWSGDTDMQCMSQAIGQTIKHAYAHHIQRLMITGNFALLCGIDPHALHEWYLAVYIDAFEWVEMPNTMGMSQYADGGKLASKPYAASGAYINRMSNYCMSCRYKVSQKIGEQACPINSLYWNFIARNKDKLGGNPRMALTYRNLEKMDPDLRKAYRKQAEAFLSQLD